MEPHCIHPNLNDFIRFLGRILHHFSFYKKVPWHSKKVLDKMIDVFPGYFAKNLFSLMSTKSGNSFSFWQVMEINRFSLPKFFKKRERFEPVKSYYYRLSQYQISTSLHKYEVKLFSATFLEHKKCLFDFKLLLVL